MDFTIRQLIYAEAAAEFGSFTDAARRLGVTQASISTAITELEQRVGAKLYDRHSSRGVSLTPIGERFIHEVRILLGHVKTFQAMAERLNAQHNGEIAMTGSPAPGRRKRLNQEKKRPSHLLYTPAIKAV
jgi:DNA-binding transcriptional LysR family regulator